MNKGMKGICLLVSLLLVAPLVHAQEQKQKGASEKAYEHASDKAIFNRVSDWFSTIGKSKEEKEKIIAEKDAKRLEKRMEKQAEKQQKKAGKEMEKGQKRLEKQERKQMEKMDQKGFGMGTKKGKGKNK